MFFFKAGFFNKTLQINTILSCRTVVNFSGLNPEVEAKILKIVNGADRDGLLKLKLSEKRLNELEKYKAKNGGVGSVLELIKGNILGTKVLTKLYKDCKGDTTMERVIKNSNRQFLVPSKFSKEISTMVGVHLAPIGVSWVKLSHLTNRIQSWGLLEYPDLPKKMLPLDTYKLAMRILKQLPDGDAYIFEGASNMGLQGQKQTVTATYNLNLELSLMLLALINTNSVQNLQSPQDSTDEVENKVYFLRYRLPARLFKTLVGSECVSCISIVQQLLHEANMADLACSPILIGDDLRKSYLSQLPPQKELLGQALLLTLTFADICLRQNPPSLEAVNPNKNAITN